MWTKLSREHHRVAQKILSYLKAHPCAADSARGIAGWWVKQPLHNVIPALEFLVGQQLVEKLEIDHGHVYRRSRFGNSGRDTNARVKE